jgi:hypothetical protein
MLQMNRTSQGTLLAGFLASSIFVSSLGAQSATLAAKPAPAGARTEFHANRLSKRAQRYYNLIWGVDSLNVKYTEGGEMVRFAYRVLDPEKAKVFNDRNIEPALIDPAAGVSLVVPALEKVGKLRQSNTPEAGRSYWMAFSNKGRKVQPGHRVTVVIGQFRAEGLVVE